MAHYGDLIEPEEWAAIPAQKPLPKKEAVYSKRR
jgi:hypothetical protein